LSTMYPGSCSRNHLHVLTSPEHDLLAEIAWFESRLRQIGETGDCAYEKALARSYVQAVNQRRARLATLRQATAG
jgi:hypothetical protein